MGLFKKSRVKEEERPPTEKAVAPKVPTVREWKKDQKKKRKGDSKSFSAKKEERSSRIEALLEQRNAHRLGNTMQASRSYSPSTTSSPSQSLRDVSSIGLNTASVATKRQFFGLFGK
jgi:hypothetical protein